MLGFSSQQSSDFPLPPISEEDQRVLKKFVELFGKQDDSNLLKKLMTAAKNDSIFGGKL